MALQFSLSSPSLHRSSSTIQPLIFSPSRSSLNWTNPVRRTGGLSKGGRQTLPGQSSLETATEPVVGQVTEANKDTFWPLVKGAGSKVVVLDMYTQWCGPCKVMAPKFQELSKKHMDVVFLKLDCNQENKPLAQELGIKVVPTFKILKDNKVVKEVTGAKFDELVLAIDTAKSSL